MKKNIIKLGNKIMIPVLILAGCSFLFERELEKFTFIVYVRWFILVLAILLVISGIFHFFDKTYDKE
ncbi:MAG: hypothetical protein LBE13_15445 [Bacteroidales bacterium]|jgi:hypothetical protein|nr:hypothetical protein [Bacteroidales bacterium]